jgi:hypothetical protein
VLVLTLLALTISCIALGIFEALFGLVLMVLYAKEDGTPYLVVGLGMAVLGIIGTIGWNLIWSMPIY